MTLEDERTWLSQNYPGLKHVGQGVIEGTLSFQMFHLDGKHYIRPDPSFVSKNFERGIYLCDTYRIKIAPQPNRNWPFAYETGSRITTVATRMGKSTDDLHIYSDNRGLCLSSTMELDRTFQEGFDLAVYIDEFLVPFLFEQTYYAQSKTGEWPWGELAHGYRGLLQWLGRENDYSDHDVEATYLELMAQGDAPEARKALGVRSRGHTPCLCGSEKKTRDCCPDVKEAISRIRHAANLGIIKIDGVMARKRRDSKIVPDL